MKILLIELNSADPEILFQNERMENIRRLMALGCFGLLQTPHPSELPPDYIAEVVAEAGKQVVVTTPPPSMSFSPTEFLTFMDASRTQFELARQALQAQEWDYFRIIEPALTLLHGTSNAGQAEVIAFYLHLDQEVGAILELLGDDTLLVVLSAYGIQHPEGCFVIAASSNPLRGELQNLHLLDIAPTVLQLAGYQLPAEVPGKSLVADLALDEFTSADLTEEEEAILRERLSGLGYI